MIIVLLTILELLGYAGIVAGLALLVVTGGRGRDDASTTYWYGDEPISRADYEYLRSRNQLP